VTILLAWSLYEWKAPHSIQISSHVKPSGQDSACDSDSWPAGTEVSQFLWKTKVQFRDKKCILLDPEESASEVDILFTDLDKGNQIKNVWEQSDDDNIRTLKELRADQSGREV
jgi:hypothetical protein